MAAVPGHAGMTLIGDRSVEFYRDAVEFVDKRIKQYDSKIFLSRLLNKHTVFVASNQGVQEVLSESNGCLDLGYKSFMGGVYGDNVVFASGSEAEELRGILHSLFSTANVEQFQDTITRLTSQALEKIESGVPISIYSVFKCLATEICLSIFLDIDFENSAELAEKIVSLTTTHWHGIISLPINLRLPVISHSSYRKALQAKEQLLKIIEERLAKSSSGFPHTVHQCGFPSSQSSSSHILLFTSALVPKALASILTSFVIHLGNQPQYQEDCHGNVEKMDHMLLETQRLSPPFFGGRRLVQKDMVVDGYKILAGCAIVYMTRHAQRDEAVFADPDSFLPERWQQANAGDQDKLFLFGGGSRSCVGKHLVDKILKTVTTQLVQQFTWSSTEGSLKHKWLPVSRPQEGITVVFTKR